MNNIDSSGNLISKTKLGSDIPAVIPQREVWHVYKGDKKVMRPRKVIFGHYSCKPKIFVGISYS